MNSAFLLPSTWRLLDAQEYHHSILRKELFSPQTFEESCKPISYYSKLHKRFVLTRFDGKSSQEAHGALITPTTLTGERAGSKTPLNSPLLIRLAWPIVLNEGIVCKLLPVAFYLPGRIK